MGCRSWRVWVCAACVALGGVGDLWAAEPVRSRRLVHLFDFEERDEGNFESLPMHWYVIGRPPRTDDANFLRVPMHLDQTQRVGFGPHADASFDRQRRVSGEHSFRLAINGGSAGVFLEAGAVTAVPNSDYLITATVCTESLKHARAYLHAYFLDVRGQIIDASRSVSDPIQTDGLWQDVTLKLLGDFPNAAYIGMELMLMQPQESPLSPLGRHQVVYQEVDGRAWFDDIGIWQLPHIEIATGSPINVLRQRKSPELLFEVRDLTGQVMIADVVVLDHHMKPVDGMRRQIGSGAPPVWRWTPKLPRHGWYLVDMRVREQRRTGGGADGVPPTPIARTLGALLWLAPEPRMAVSDADRFILGAEAVDEGELQLLASLMAATGIDAAIVSAWQDDTTLLSIEQQQEALDQVIATLTAQGRRVTVSLNPVPRELARSLDIDAHNPAGLFTHPDSAWLPYLSPVLIRQGQIIRRWQVGTPDHAALFDASDLVDLHHRIETAFRDLAPDPRLVWPWSLAQSRQAEVSSKVEFALDVSPRIAAERMADHLSDWQQGGTAATWLHLRPPAADVMDHERRAIDLALKMLSGWEADVAGLALSRPWTDAPTRHVQILPDPMLGVFANVAHRLAGRKAVGRMVLQPGIECIILASRTDPHDGSLVLWNHHAQPGDETLRLFLGPDPVAIDLWGNRAQVPLQDNHHVIEVTRAPVFVEGIDPALAMFRSSFAVDEPFIESRQGRHQRVLRFRNPWKRTISGSFHVIEPKGWFISPVKQFFSVAAGEEATFPMELAFPVSELAGPKRLTARFDFMAEQRYVVNLSTPMEVGLDNVTFDATLAVTADEKTGRPAAIVTQLITNTGDQPLALYAFAHLVGYPRQERIISQLLPGQSIVRRFTFPDVENAIQQHAVRVGLRETNGPAVLNQSLTPGRE